MLDLDDPWISHKDLKISKDAVSINVDTRDFNLVVSNDAENTKLNIDLQIVDNPKYVFTTAQVKATINRLFKLSGGEKKWRFLHFINEKDQVIYGGNWQFKYLRFYKLKPNTWICKPRREDIKPVQKEVFEYKIFGDILASHKYAKEQGWVKEDSEFDESQVVHLKDKTRESEKRSEEIVEYKPRTVSAKVYRNDPCPCGSGKKHKKCCLNKK